MIDGEVQFTIETAVVARVVEVEITERLDAPYEARVHVEVDDPEQAAEAFLGQDAVIRWGRESAYERALCGLVRGVRARPRFDSHSHFELDIAPAFALLALTRNTRMFQEKTVPEVLEAVLGEKLGPYSREVQLDLSAEYPRREYCLQYQESDLDFIHRLTQEEGISYSFEHDGSVEKMVLRDSNSSYVRVPDAADPVRYRARAERVVGDEESIVRVDRVHDTGVTAVKLRDFDWSTAGYLVEAEASGEDAEGRVRESYEHGWGRSATIWDYDAGAARYQERDASRLKDVRIEAHRTRDLVARGVGVVVGFSAGRTFELVDHPLAGFDGEFLITEVVHRAGVPGRHDARDEGGRDSGGRDEGGRERYHNVFDCIPLATPHRPARRAAKPRIAGVQTAIVTGPSGEEIHTDEHGRVKVQFHWDRENPADETSSMWVRVQQKWAGASWGFVWLPRIGMEVVVQFLDGDPDRPVVTGCVYNATNATPYELPAEKTKSTIKSNSSLGGGGSNEWRFEDKAGSEEVFTHAQKDYNEVVENDHTTHVGHDQTIQVDNDQTQTIHNNQTEDVGANQKMTVDGNRTVHVEGNFDETVSGTESRTVSGAVSETFDANETRSVGADLTEKIGAGETRTIGGAQSETISASHTVTIGGSSTETVAAALSETITGGITTVVAGNWTATAAGGFNVTAAAGINLTLIGGLTVAAPGGVDQTDGIFQTLKGTNQWEGALRLGAVGFKDETTFLHFCFTGLKTGAIGAEIPNLGFAAEAKSLAMWKSGFHCKFLGADVDKEAAESQS